MKLSRTLCQPVVTFSTRACDDEPPTPPFLPSPSFSFRETFSKLTISNERIYAATREIARERYPPFSVERWRLMLTFKAKQWPLRLQRGTVTRSFRHVTYKNTMSLPRETHLALPRSKPSASYGAILHHRAHTSFANDPDSFYFVSSIKNISNLIFRLTKT